MSCALPKLVEKGCQSRTVGAPRINDDGSEFSCAVSTEAKLAHGPSKRLLISNSHAIALTDVAPGSNVRPMASEVIHHVVDDVLDPRVGHRWTPYRPRFWIFRLQVRCELESPVTGVRQGFQMIAILSLTINQAQRHTRLSFVVGDESWLGLMRRNRASLETLVSSFEAIRT